MTKEELEIIGNQTQEILLEIIENHPIEEGDLFVIGCSSSEVVGGTIGKNSKEEIGEQIFLCAHKILASKGIHLACQCCEHLNRALVVEKEYAQKNNLDPVCVIPWLHGGGAFATAAYNHFKEPVVVEHIKASAGIDIGDTLIGMHLKEVAVPIHLKQNKIGHAHVLGAYTRPKLIGGERARY